jgi:peptidyl-prolyl cis-trans isomerase C
MHMPQLTRLASSMFAVLLAGSVATAQTTPPPSPTSVPAQKPAAAAIVNGEAVPERAVERALQAVPADERAKARTEVIQFLVDNMIIDQYLAALKVTIDPKEVNEHLAQFQADVKKNGQDYGIVLGRMNLTEPELKEQIHNQLRWEKFVNQQATDEKLKKLFDSMPEAFDGTSVRARHILLPGGATEETKKQAVAKIHEIKQSIEKEVSVGLAKLPADADNVTKEQKKNELIEEAFGKAAKTSSTCPSKDRGGDLNWFPRYGAMVEPFAKAAFAMKAFQLSEAISTQFGYHLILVTGRKPGVPTKFEDEKVKPVVKDVYEARLKEAVLDQMKPRAKIEIIPQK